MNFILTGRPRKSGRFLTWDVGVKTGFLSKSCATALIRLKLIPKLREKILNRIV